MFLQLLAASWGDCSGTLGFGARTVCSDTGSGDPELNIGIGGIN